MGEGKKLDEFFINIRYTGSAIEYLLSPGTVNQFDVEVRVKCNGAWQLKAEDANNVAHETGGYMTKYAKVKGEDTFDTTKQLINPLYVSTDYEGVRLSEGGTILIGGSTYQLDGKELDVPVTFKQAVTWKDTPLGSDFDYRIDVAFIGSALV